MGFVLFHAIRILEGISRLSGRSDSKMPIIGSPYSILPLNPRRSLGAYVGHYIAHTGSDFVSSKS
ncbi:hypothetical protein sscle_09g070720 [Sclerotinia sclerotiorum 1980 UF-70]|uniref:Uncharacterized protein n=1 Tax=Sclerotinia sclerotiorum (strain ATCC 18683 / 1980 / Ss-1) TaxID=665079 RepID=A0A1D9QBZ8_SCLS1|nr:hypothetical protein sscle_09g070720 [Sclerotinia sclerotiorum 1980 UF-70]